MIRSTRLVDLVNTMDPKLVAAAFGMDPQATLIYLADRVAPGRLPDQYKPRHWVWVAVSSRAAISALFLPRSGSARPRTRP